MPGKTGCAVTLLCSLLLSLSPHATAARAQGRAAPAFKLTQVRAQLFDERTGTFSSDLFAEPESALRNRRTATGRQTSLLVVFELTGAAESFAPQRRLRFTATEGRKVLLSRSAPVGILNGEGKYYVAFWLYDIGCKPLTLTARLTGQTNAPTLNRSLNFTCGD